MENSASEKLNTAEQLMDEGKFDEALESIRVLELSTNLTKVNALDCQILKSKLFFKKGDLDTAQTLVNGVISRGTEEGSELQVLSASLVLGYIHMKKSEMHQALTLAKEVEEKLHLLDDISSQRRLKEVAFVNTLLGTIHGMRDEFTLALRYFENFLKASIELGDIQGIARANNNLGLINRNKGDHELAMRYYEESLKVKKQIGNKQDIAMTLNNMGIIYSDKGDLRLAHEYYQEALEYFEEIGNKRDIIMVLHNLIGNYKDLGSLDKALECANRSLVILEDIENHEDLAITLINISGIYQAQGELDLSMEQARKALDLFIILERQSGVAQAYYNIGSLLVSKGDLEGGLENHQRGLAIRERLANKQDLAMSFIQIGRIYRQKGELDKALESLEQSLNIHEEIGNTQNIARVLEELGKVYQFQGREIDALNAFERSLKLRIEIGNNVNLCYALYCLIEFSAQYNRITDLETYLHQLDTINNEQPNKHTELLYRLAKIIHIHHQGEDSAGYKAKDILHQILDEEIIDHELTITGMLKLAGILVTEFVTTGDTNILNEVNSLLESVLLLASKQYLHGVELLTMLIQVKIALINYDLDKARDMLRTIQSSSTIRGFNFLVEECEKTHNRLIQYSSMDIILDLQEEEQKQLQHQHVEDIYDYLKEEAFRLTSSRLEKEDESYLSV